MILGSSKEHTKKQWIRPKAFSKAKGFTRIKAVQSKTACLKGKRTAC